MHSSTGKGVKGPKGYSEVASDGSRGCGPGGEALAKEDCSPAWGLVERAWLRFGPVTPSSSHFSFWEWACLFSASLTFAFGKHVISLVSQAHSWRGNMPQDES